ncbi:porin [Shigella flexneri]
MVYTISRRRRKDGDHTYVRLGFKGETRINDQLTSYGQWEYDVRLTTPKAGTSDQASTVSRPSPVSALLSVGSFDYGRNYGVVYDVTSWTDVLPGFRRRRLQSTVKPDSVLTALRPTVTLTSSVWLMA